MSSVLCQAVWRLAFLSSFFFLPGFVDQCQVSFRDTLSPYRRVAALAFSIFLLLSAYRLGGELLEVRKGRLRWPLLGGLLFGAFLVALCLLVVLGTQGEEWLLRGISLLMVASVVRYTLRFMASPEGTLPLLALGDLTYLGSVFFAALYRHHHNWGKLAGFILGNIKGVQFWAPLAAALLFLATLALCFQAARLSLPQMPPEPAAPGAGESSPATGEA